MQRVRKATVVAKRGRRREARELRGVRAPGTRLRAGRRGRALSPGRGPGQVEQHLQAVTAQVADGGVGRAPSYPGLEGSAGSNDEDGEAGAPRPSQVDPNNPAPSDTARGIQIAVAAGASPVRAGSALKPSVRPGRERRGCGYAQHDDGNEQTEPPHPGPISSCGGHAGARARRPPTGWRSAAGATPGRGPPR